MRGDFYLDGWLVQPQLNLISRTDHAMRIEPKAMLVLVYLSLHPEEVVTKQAIKKEVWRDIFVTDHVLIRCISELRKAFQDDSRSPRILQTISRGGYRLIPPVVRSGEISLKIPAEDPDPATEETAGAVVPTSKARDPRRFWIPLAFVIIICLLLALLVAGVGTLSWNGTGAPDSLEGAALRVSQPSISRKLVEPRAYEAYLKGRHCTNRISGQSLTKAVLYFRRAIALDPGFALAYAGLADAFGLMAQHGIENPDQCYHLSKAAALRALELDQSAPEPRAALALALMCHDLNWRQAEDGFRQAIAMNSSYAAARYWLALCLLAQGRVEEAIREAETARALDPVSPVFPAMLARAFAIAGRHEAAIRVCLDSLELDPSEGGVRLLLAECYWRLGQSDKATASLPAITGAGDEHTRKLKTLSSLFAGELKRGRSLLKAVESAQISADADPAFWARIAAILGEDDMAFSWLEKAFERRETGVLLLKVDPAYRSLRHDARFAHLVSRLGLPAAEE